MFLRKYGIYVLTHLLVLGLGVGISLRLGAREERRNDTKATKSQKLEVRRGQTSHQVFETLLGEAREELAKDKDERENRKEKWAAYKQEVKALLVSTEKAEDTKGAALAALQGLGLTGDYAEDEDKLKNGEAVVRLIHWMQDNPEEALAYIQNEEREETRHFRRSNLSVILAEGFPGLSTVEMTRQIMPYRPDSSRFSWAYRSAIIDRMEESGGLYELEGVENVLNAKDFKNLRRSVGYNWPADRWKELANYAEENNGPQMLKSKIRRLGNRNYEKGSSEALSQMAEAFAKGDFSENFQKKVEDTLFSVRMSMNAQNLSLEERMQEAAKSEKYSPEWRRKRLIEEIIPQDLDKVFKNKGDWNYEFNNGVKTANEVLAEVRKEAPDLWEADKVSFARKVYKELALLEPEKAREVWDGIPEVDVESEMWRAASDEGSIANAEGFYRLVSKIPDKDGENGGRSRERAWESFWYNSGNDVQDEHVEWARNLPHGGDRSMALNTLADEIAEGWGVHYTELAEELRREALE